MDESGINVTKVRNQLYDNHYGGCCRRVCCMPLKPCNRKLRNHNIKTIMRKEDDALKNEIFGIPPKKHLKEDMIALILALVGAYTEISHHITDVVLLWDVYWIGMANKDIQSYKFATVFIFMCLTSPYLIAYSSMINMLLFKGVYEPA